MLWCSLKQRNTFAHRAAYSGDCISLVTHPFFQINAGIKYLYKAKAAAYRSRHAAAAPLLLKARRENRYRLPEQTAHAHHHTITAFCGFHSDSTSFPCRTNTFVVRHICFLLWRKYSPIWRGCQAYLYISAFSYKFSRFVECKICNMSENRRGPPRLAAPKACRTGKNLL